MSEATTHHEEDCDAEYKFGVFALLDFCAALPVFLHIVVLPPP